MNTAGTIDRPLTHDPKKQAPMKPSTERARRLRDPDFTSTGANDSRQNRTREMQLIPEALARAHMHERLQEAEQERRADAPGDRPPHAAPGRARLAACPPCAGHGGHAVVDTPEAVASRSGGDSLTAGAGPSERTGPRGALCRRSADRGDIVTA